MPCPNEDAILQAMAQGQEAEFLSHAKTCQRCRQILSLSDMLLTPEASANTDRAVANLLLRVESERRASRLALPKWLGLAAGAVVGIVSLLMWQGDNAEYRARGRAGNRSLLRDVGISFRTHKNVERPLSDGATIARSDRLVVSHRNIGPNGVYALIFAVDSAGTVHWMYPAHATDESNETSIALKSTTTEVPQAESIGFDDVALGTIHFYAVVTSKPERVRDVESLSLIDPQSLELRFDDALVVSISAQVVNE